MPSRNVDKVDIPESFYHVYARGISRQKIFLEAADYRYFLGLFARYLSEKPVISKTGIVYPHHRGRLELAAYCLMQNHFHMLLYQVEQGAMRHFMQGLMTSYSRYFNLKYKRSGPLFESRYKAVRIDRDEYLQHISRYIHLNPRYWQHYRYSSIRYYVGDEPPEWLQPQRMISLFDGVEDYRTFVADYEDNHHALEQIKHELADY